MAATTTSDEPVTLMVWFVSTLPTFRFPEIDSLAVLLGGTVNYDRTQNVELYPFVRVEFSSMDFALALAKRALGIKMLFELWGAGKTYEESVEACRQAPDRIKAKWIRVDTSFKMIVDGFGRKLSKPEQIERIEKYTSVGFEGPVKMTNPDAEFIIVEEWGPPERIASTDPVMIYMGRILSRGARHLMDVYDLKKRKYLGTTSMNAELSLLQSNQALAAPGTLVYDPFVGTGSLLITSAAFGAACIGSDIDLGAIRGWGKRYEDRQQVRRDIWVNFQQYGLTDLLIDCVRSDQSHDPFRETEIFDAIVADPPYGIRAGAKRVKPNETRTLLAGGNQNTHVPMCAQYRIEDVLVDMLGFASRMLRVGGRLVYWLPTTIEYTDADLPTHPGFEIIANSVQGLSLYFQRRLITMVKTSPYNAQSIATVPASLVVPEEALDGEATDAPADATATSTAAGAGDESAPAHADIRKKLWDSARPKFYKKESKKHGLGPDGRPSELNSHKTRRPVVVLKEGQDVREQIRDALANPPPARTDLPPKKRDKVRKPPGVPYRRPVDETTLPPAASATDTGARSAAAAVDAPPSSAGSESHAPS